MGKTAIVLYCLEGVHVKTSTQMLFDKTYFFMQGGKTLTI